MHLMVDFEGYSVKVLTYAKKGPYVGGSVKSLKQLQDYSNHSVFTQNLGGIISKILSILIFFIGIFKIIVFFSFVAYASAVPKNKLQNSFLLASQYQKRIATMTKE